MEILLACDKNIHHCPFVVLQNVYNMITMQALSSDPNALDAYLTDLESDLLVECCKYGNVLRVLTPEEGTPLGDCIVVIFSKNEEARSCAQAVHEKAFDGRQLLARCVFSASNVVEANLNFSGTGISLANDIENTDMIDNEEDVDDFLNSLL